MPNLPKLTADISDLSLDLTNRVWEQFQRDLNKTGDTASQFKEESLSVNDLLTSIRSTIDLLVRNNEEGFWQLLYIVDLPEVFLSNIELSEKGLDEVARIVLIREWQKVILRQHFSAS